MPRSLCALHYDREWYFGKTNFVSPENADVNLMFLHPNGPFVRFSWPSCDDTTWILLLELICKAKPQSTSTGWFYCFTSDGNRKVECSFKEIKMQHVFWILHPAGFEFQLACILFLFLPLTNILDTHL